MQKVEIHHVEPQADGGTDDEDNAAPLCSNCHTSFGGNPELRKEIRSRRDAWYRQCAAGNLQKNGERRGTSLHSVMVGLLREWQAVRSSLKSEIDYYKETMSADAEGLMTPISEELDEASELFGFKAKISAFMSFITPDDMVPFRRAHRRMAMDLKCPTVIEYEGTIGHDDQPMPFTSFHDVGLNICLTANTLLNLPFAIKSYQSTRDASRGPRSNEIIAQMQIEATYMEADEATLVSYDESTEEDGVGGTQQSNIPNSV